MKVCSNCKHGLWAIDDICELTPICTSCGFVSKDGFSVPSNWEPLLQTDAAESVVHPYHYNQGKYECIDVMLETFGKEATKNFCLLNAFKYIWRTGEKNGIEDIKKARFYLDFYISLEEGK